VTVIQVIDVKKVKRNIQEDLDLEAVLMKKATGQSLVDQVEKEVDQEIDAVVLEKDGVDLGIDAVILEVDQEIEEAHHMIMEVALVIKGVDQEIREEISVQDQDHLKMRNINSDQSHR